MRKEQKANIAYRAAMIDIIDDVLRRNKTHCLSFERSSFCGNADLLEFQCDGHKCRLLAVEKPDIRKGTMIMRVLAKGKELTDWEDMRLNFNIAHFRPFTLKAIAYQVYDWLKLPEDTEFEDVCKKKVADWYDTHL